MELTKVADIEGEQIQMAKNIDLDRELIHSERKLNNERKICMKVLTCPYGG